MDPSKFISRKLLAAMLATAAVVVADLLGVPLDPDTLDTVQNLLMTYTGAQGGVDMVAAYKAGTSIAGTARVLKEELPEEAGEGAGDG